MWEKQMEDGKSADARKTGAKTATMGGKRRRGLAEVATLTSTNGQVSVTEERLHGLQCADDET